MSFRLMPFGILAAVLLTALPAFAQVLPQGRRPYAGLFGGSAQDARHAQGLNFTASLGGGYDNDRSPDPSGSGVGSSASALRDGSYGIGAASLSYGISGDGLSGSLYGGGRARYYPNVSSPLVGTSTLGGDLSAAIGTRVTLDTSHSVGLYVRGADFYGLYGDINGPGVPGGDETLGALTTVGRYTSLRSNVGIRAKLTQRVGMYAAYNYYTNNLMATSTGRYNASGVNGGVTYAMFKSVSLRAGYTRTRATTGTVAGQAAYGQNSFDGGVDFNKALSLTRHSTLVFATGLSGVADQQGTVRYLFIGNATLSYELGRSWTLQGYIGRSTDFFAAFAQPTVMDRANVSVNGLLSRRVQVSVSAALIKSESLAPIVVSGYTAGHSGVSVKYALNRDLALTADYSYYRYQFDNSALLPPGVLTRINRQSVRVSFDVWAPLLTQSRRQ